MQASTKLLIVDDLPENLTALHAIVRAPGREIYQAVSGEDALALLLQHDFAMAILDVQMPGMDGFELAELMRGTDRTRQIPIVFVSAAGKELNYAFKGYEAGAVDFLYKPLDAAAVQSKVNVFVTLYEQREETRRQLAELELARQRQEATLAELNVTQEQLRHALRMRDEFMSMVSHELRTPLNTLFLETQMRKLQLDRGNMAAFEADKLQHMVARDRRQLQSMIRLIEDMLDVTRIRSGVLSTRPSWVELQGLLRRLVNDLAPQAANAGSRFELHADQPVHGWWDEFRIEQVVINLLTNALRYGASQPVDVSLHVGEREVRIEVRDGGPGIAAEFHARIFDPYERGVDNGEKTGLGLGLYIARQLAQVHDGELTLRSAPGEGSTFILTLPRREAPEGMQAGAAPPR
ncbi:hybrid sensor histidine kinase/response regulator [Oxalobacteraceae bacterium]|nr:hybrid sensor histidine kinase/response regulator [Oxalobacteraceae bacterium]